MRRIVLVAVGFLVLLLAVAALPRILRSDAPPPQHQEESASAKTSPAPSLLTWEPPELDDPAVVKVSDERRSLELDPDGDYIIQLPEQPLIVDGGLTITGGRNVVLIGGEIRMEEGEGLSGRALLLRDQTGTVHVEGLLLTGPGLTEGINLDQRQGAVVQLQNIHVSLVDGSSGDHHADLVQSWAGPGELRVDRFTGVTAYQGFFLQPLQFGDQTPRRFDFRRIDIVGTEKAGYLLWRDDASWPMTTSDVWLRHEGDVDDFVWSDGNLRDEVGDGINLGTPPGGSFAPADVVGRDYVSPGYDEQRQ
ncbi:hypothetical protein BJF86_02505 [Serinicoccus sp. CNJ-927]|uniref:hypothetical protein n=1 Tax=Serinicoccus sp. CNJ-927 TaxID=1904970 RepID=UPI00095B8D25|nr:hypothetical protein [Serinicoccus sp. CNJ-927]OLT41897.1 hypothetical protein BJF86_02505 [Serinicoccus sp. CNJ-927]